MEYSSGDIVWRLIAVLALVFANGFFVAAEFSIVTVRKTRIDQLIAEGNWRAHAVRRAVSDPDSYIAATQLGITMASIGLGWIGEPALASVVEPALRFLPTPLATTTAHTIAVAVAFAIITALHIVLGELAPKTVALERPESTALWVVKPTELFMKAFWPFIRLLNGAGRAVVNLMGLRSRGGHAMVHSEEELKMLVTASQEAGVLEEAEEQMLHRVFAFADLTAGQVMVPRTELVAADADTPGAAVLAQIIRSNANRMLVFRNNLDNVVGILYITDVVRALADGARNLNPASLAREALTVPETLAADDVLAAMRRRGVQEAVVIDEYGGTAGLVTFESLMERIVGDSEHRRRPHQRPARRLGRHRRPDARDGRQRAVRPRHRRRGVHNGRRLRAGATRPARARRRHDRSRRPADAGRGGRRAAGREGLALDAEAKRIGAVRDVVRAS